ncbi:transglycosylase domain-containing protein [Virgibacillus oceani]|uniref:Penicillin-binding protein 2D n=1 Tax=Virgibacillus oceani TaxID=1479511 RepID=A0A917M2I2_9BACI|nr:transglycosylase domain-containing protein [Virgibacillus oceani]GGG70861.1 penicillin-binding protein 2D [Virgibacillus oceani]
MKWKFFKHKKSRLALTAAIGALILALSFIAGVYLVSFLLGPPELSTEQNTIYYSNSGDVIGEERGNQSRYWIDLEDISPHLVQATLLIEDQHFRDHNGFDLPRIASAVLTNIKSMSLKEGASTLTQQYARNLYLSFEKTWTRKLREAFYTVRLEMYYSKDEILEGYLNTIYYGHGAYGIEAASRYFFNKSASELTIAESAMLAAIPKGPTYYSPYNDMENAKKRQNRILGIMLEKNAIDEEEYFLAKRENLAFAEPKEQRVETVAPYFQDTVLKEAAEILDIDKELVRSGGFQIYTTLDLELQQKLEAKITNVFQPESKIEVGAIALEPTSGAIQALVGGRDYESSQFNRAIQAKRMPGSAFKPFLYYAALENGYTPTTMLMSKPTAFELEDGKVYQPSNYNGYYAYEPITLAQALALSDNVYAVKTNLFLGAEKLVETAKDFGIDSKLPAVPSLALGTAAVTVEDMVTGYGMIANGGHQIEGHTINKIVDRKGKVVFESEDEEGKQLLDPKSLYILSQLMTGMFDHALDGYMSVTGSPITDELTRKYAGKSGTTNSDSWMIGFSPELVTGVWAGYDDNRSIDKVAEETYSKKVWAAFMEAAHKGLPKTNFDAPPDIVSMEIDPESGKRATPYCETSRVMYFEKGTEPDEYCDVHFPGEEKPDSKEKDGIVKKFFDIFF